MNGKTILSLLIFSAAITVVGQTTLDKQAHRGGRGLMPENTIPAMKHAMDLQVTTLEMDLYLSKDKKLVVSHDDRLSPNFVLDATGRSFTADEGKLYVITRMNYAQIETFDVGSKPNPAFPRKKDMLVHIPLFEALIDSVEIYARMHKLRAPRYNIEAKIPARENLPDSMYKRDIIRAMVATIKKKKIQDRVMIQSFDVDALELLHREFPTVAISYLVSKNTLEENLRLLDFTPRVYSPSYNLVDKKLVDDCHRKGIKIIVWTPNTKAEIALLTAMGVDGVITDYPDLFEDK